MMVRFIFPDFSLSDKPHQFGDRTVHRMRVYSHISQVSITEGRYESFI